jgi:hypothetical protein
MNSSGVKGSMPPQGEIIQNFYRIMERIGQCPNKISIKIVALERLSRFSTEFLHKLEDIT